MAGTRRRPHDPEHRLAVRAAVDAVFVLDDGHVEAVEGGRCGGLLADPPWRTW